MGVPVSPAANRILDGMTSVPPEPPLRAALAPQQSPARENGKPPGGSARLRRRLRELQGDDTGEQIAALLVAGVAAELFFVILAIRFWLTKFFPFAPGSGAISVGFPQMMSGDWTADARWLSLVLAAPFGAFVVALWYARAARSRLAAAIVFGFALIFGLTLLGCYPITAADLFHYLADARTLWVYHANPMQTPPQAHPFVIGISWQQQPSPYGPFWQLLALLPVVFTGDHYVAGVIGFKLLGLLSYLACGALIYLTVRRAWPGRELLAALVFLWNPFVVFRVVGNGHNDATMMAFALAGLYLIVRRHWRAALPLLALSVCIKYSTALILPPVLVYAWFASDAAGRRRLLQGAGLALLLSLAIFAPFWQGADTFKTFIQNTNLVITSVPQIVTVLIHPQAPPTAPDAGVKLAGYLLFGLAYLTVLYALFRRPSFERLVAGCAIVFIAYLTLSTWWFRPWYFLWILALAALLPSFWWTALALAACFGATFFDLIEQYRTNWTWIWESNFRSYAAPVVSVFVPLLLVLLIGMVWTRDWAMLKRGWSRPIRRSRLTPQRRTL